MTLGLFGSETDNLGRAYQAKLLDIWSEYTHFHAHKIIEQNYLKRLILDLMGAIQLKQEYFCTLHSHF